MALAEEALGRCLAQPSGTTCFELFACLLEDDVNLNASQVNFVTYSECLMKTMDSILLAVFFLCEVV